MHSPRPIAYLTLVLVLFSSCTKQSMRSNPATSVAQSRGDRSAVEEAVRPAATPASKLLHKDELAGKEADRFNREGYSRIVDNPFLRASENPLSTFSIDVDTASYSNVRRFLTEGQLPPPDAVRIEELVNYFDYNYPQPAGKDPFSVTTELSQSPWNSEHRLLHVGLQGKKIETESLPESNLVFLVDVSGSMDEPDKLPLLQSALSLLVENLRDRDRVALVVYAGAAGVVLPSTGGDQRQDILNAIQELSAGGSTAGGEGIVLAYEIAEKNFIRGGNNRVILATDGDFNVGVSSDGDLERLIEAKRQGGVFLTVLGFGTGNYQDAKMELLADKGNGNYAYIDSISEARKVLIDEMGGTLLTIAKDVKIQVEFNPAHVQAYRLIGYENRSLRAEDFNDDKKDAGEIGAGHSVTALYEIVPPGVSIDLPSVDALQYQTRGAAGIGGSELLTVKIRYKDPDGEESRLMSTPVANEVEPLEETSTDFRFAAAVAELGMLLRSSEYKGNSSYQDAVALARNAIGEDEHGYRGDFVELAQRAASLSTSSEGR